jgi:hypothetical protein
MVRILIKILVVESAEVVGVFSLVLLYISLVNPTERVHEPSAEVSFVVSVLLCR